MFQLVIDPTTYQLTFLHLAQFIYSFYGIGTCKAWFIAEDFKIFCLILETVFVFLEKEHFPNCLTLPTCGSNEWSFSCTRIYYSNTVNDEIVILPSQSGYGTPMRYVYKSTL